MISEEVSKQSPHKKNKFLSLSIHHSKNKDSSPISNDLKNNDDGATEPNQARILDNKERTIT